MRMFLKSTTVALALAGAALVTTGMAGAADGYIATDRSDHPVAAISIGLGDIAFGYRDGYWDNGHNWHRWKNDEDSKSYRDKHVNDYHDWNHDRDADNGWLRH